MYPRQLRDHRIARRGRVEVEQRDLAERLGDPHPACEHELLCGRRRQILGTQADVHPPTPVGVARGHGRPRRAASVETHHGLRSGLDDLARHQVHSR